MRRAFVLLVLALNACQGDDGTTPTCKTDSDCIQRPDGSAQADASQDAGAKDAASKDARVGDTSNDIAVDAKSQ